MYVNVWAMAAFSPHLREKEVRNEDSKHRHTGREEGRYQNMK
jgi:hypothetical protein